MSDLDATKIVRLMREHRLRRNEAIDIFSKAFAPILIEWRLRHEDGLELDAHVLAEVIAERAFDVCTVEDNAIR